MLTAVKAAITTAMLATVGFTPVCCDLCNASYPMNDLQTHVFEEWHEFDHGAEIIVYTMEVCPSCSESL